jgi:predicted N-formylglutamate amidohydrolase
VSLLSPDEPPAFSVENRNGASPFVLTCDHASRRIPITLGSLGLTAAQLSSHIAWDIGAAGVARRLAQRLDAPLILQNYSRLVIDCNRPTSSSESIAIQSDGSFIAGNDRLDAAAADARRRAIFDPYHDELRSILEQRTHGNRRVILVAVHSFTPMFQGRARPWHIGLMYRDERLAAPLLTILRQTAQLLVGDNEPYAIEDGVDYSIPHHCESRGIPHAGLEIRQDLIADDAGQELWANLLHDALNRVLSARLPIR